MQQQSFLTNAAVLFVMWWRCEANRYCMPYHPDSCQSAKIWRQAMAVVFTNADLQRVRHA
ncbi:unnamed protein product [Tuber melanosporum]|uniref:(Perigord truffle) hypothetical protein n=1 Tax=Tuber melanosporum (strain Mel28) TaxID=656061 RepID=D5GKE2_TUBMM|nr:uncharacterized protein GSTUM_00009499001 [Tuber melanosporum]CAZ84985.1 unnamed protein product [Tuber melanosporum]